MADTDGSSANIDPEAELLPRRSDSASSDRLPADQAGDHSVRTAPVFTSEALAVLGEGLMPQRAVYGSLLSSSSHGGGTCSLGSNESDSETMRGTRSTRLYMNTNAPFSAVVCGLQGSGKSHSTSVILEGCLIQDPRLGTLPAPLCGLLFHFDSAAGSGYVQPCEAAYLASMDAVRGGKARAPEVTVLVMPNRVEAMKHVYAKLPGVRVEALRFTSGDISGERLLAMMKVDENNQMPLYMELILTLLRDMEVFDYNQFRVALAQQRLNGSQKSMLNLRLALLDSCLKGGNESNCVTKYFQQGALTIVDLSSPFIDSSSACGFFDIILSLFVEAEVKTGKIIVLDEAHKYLSDTGHSSKLTESLLSIIRQQRHLNARVVISTQEPTVVPSKFLELSSFIIAHRFSSPKWLQHLAEHVSAAQGVKDEIFEKIIDLRTGEGIMFAPSGLGVKSDSSSTGRKAVAPFGQGYLVVHSRQRITRDGGHSFLAVSDEDTQTRFGRVAAPRVIQQNLGVESSQEIPPYHEGSSSVSTAGLREDAYTRFVRVAAQRVVRQNLFAESSQGIPPNNEGSSSVNTAGLREDTHTHFGRVAAPKAVHQNLFVESSQEIPPYHAGNSSVNTAGLKEVDFFAMGDLRRSLTDSFREYPGGSFSAGHANHVSQSEIVDASDPPLPSAEPSQPSSADVVLVPVTSVDQIVSKKALKDSAARLPTNTLLDYDIHVPIILVILKELREQGIFLVSYGKFKKYLKARCGYLETTNAVVLKKFLVEASKEGEFLFLRNGTTGSHTTYLKLPGPEERRT